MSDTDGNGGGRTVCEHHTRLECGLLRCERDSVATQAAVREECAEIRTLLANLRAAVTENHRIITEVLVIVRCLEERP